MVPFVMWSDVPVGSTFNLTCDGDSKVLDGVAMVTVDGAEKPSFEVGTFCPGPVKIAVTANGEALDVTVTIIAMKKLSTAFNLTASVEKSGTVVQVPDGKGNMIPAKKTWTSGKAAGSTIDVAILVTAVPAAVGTAVVPS